MASLGLKRKHDDDDDDMATASRSPSPIPDAMDVDTYDTYSPYQQVTVDSKIQPSNKGFALLSKLGWADGQHLGLSTDGRTEPVPFTVKSDTTGLGKVTQDVRMIESTVSQRRGLDSERQTKESEEQRRMREDDAARRSAIAHEVTDTLKAFYCSLCDKQFKNVAQYDEHTNSYAHHHKARFRDMQNNVRIQAKDEVEKRKEKERKREEKELRKIAAANGIRMAKTMVALPATPVETESTPMSPSTGFKKSGSSEQPLASSSLPPSPLSQALTSVEQPPHITLANPEVNAANTTLPNESRPSKAQASRAGWQQFQKSNSRRH